MSGFLGLLCCGGRGKRLGRITDYISKAFVPVYDRPVFEFPLAQLKQSKHIDDIVLLTNFENDTRLTQTGYRTIIQDDEVVFDMFTGLAYVRQVIGDERPVVVMPCDNISEICVNKTIDVFLEKQPDIAINIRRIENPDKLREMGVFDPDSGKIEYRPTSPKTNWGVIAPYVVKPGLDTNGSTESIINRSQVVWTEYDGIWFDVGDVASLCLATTYFSEAKSADGEL